MHDYVVNVNTSFLWSQSQMPWTIMASITIVIVDIHSLASQHTYLLTYPTYLPATLA
jgi:hypothetical protein